MFSNFVSVFSKCPIHLKTASIRANLELNCNNGIFGLKRSLGTWFSPKKSCQKKFHWDTLFWAVFGPQFLKNGWFFEKIKFSSLSLLRPLFGSFLGTESTYEISYTILWRFKPFLDISWIFLGKNGWNYGKFWKCLLKDFKIT